MRPPPQHPHLAQIRTLYAAAHPATREHGCQWYAREHAAALLLAKSTGRPVRTICACLAVLSPRCQWPRVKHACSELLAGNEPRGIFGHNLAKAEKILASRGLPIDPTTAPKTWAFWQNLWHPNDPIPVTLDSWMFRAHGMPDSIRLGTYQALAEAYRSVASELGLIPNQLQAIVWLHIKQRSHPTAKENARERR